MSEAREKRLEFSEGEWEELREAAAHLSALRGREVGVPDLVRAAVREYVYRHGGRRRE